MFDLHLYKRICGISVLLFGLLFGGGLVEAAQSAITADGCTVVRVQGSFNAPLGLPEAAPVPNAPAHCANVSFNPTLDLDLSFSYPVNTTSPVILDVTPAFWAAVTGNVNNASDFGVPPVILNACKLFWGGTNDNPLGNKGRIDFDNEEPEGGFRTCLELVQTAPTTSTYRIFGWAWNTNLGWFAMEGLDDGNGNILNTGIDVGATEFKSAIEVTPYAANDGKLFGYWWNDVAGWVKLNCEARVALNATDFDNCSGNGGADYGVYIDSFDSNSGRALLAGYAWSDVVGYIDFTGVEVDIPGFSLNYMPEVKYIKNTSDPNGVVRANGVDGYDVEVRFYKGSANVTDEFADENLNNGFCLVYEDKRVLDEIAGTYVSKSGGGSAMYDCDLDLQATLQDDLGLNNMSWDAGANDVLGNGNVDKFTYDSAKKAFVSSSKVVSRIPSVNGDIGLKGVQIRNGVTGVDNQFASLNPMFLEFEPPYELNFVGGKVTGPDLCKESSLLLDFENPMEASICGEYMNSGGKLGALEVGVASEPKVNQSYEDRFDSITSQFNNSKILSNSSGYGSVDLEVSLNLASGVEAAEIEPIAALLDFRLSSTASYQVGGYVVRRLGPDLADDSKNIFEVNVQGGLVDRSFDSIQFSSGSKDTLGVSQGIDVKQNVYKTLRNILYLKPGSCSGLNLERVNSADVTALISGCGRVSMSGGKNVVYLASSDGEDAYVTYTEMQKLIETQTLAAQGGAPVIVLDGLDLVIDENIMPRDLLQYIKSYKTLAGVPENILKNVAGFVVLKSEDTGQGGEVIISADVTDVAAYIYADGRALSAGNDALARQAASGNPEVVLNRSLMDETNLYNQFSYLGLLYSSNCIGCSSKSPALRADGSVADSRTLSLMEDLNAFRYTPLKFEIQSGVYTLEYDFDEDGVIDFTNDIPYSCYVACDDTGQNWVPTFNGNGEPQCEQVGIDLDLDRACFDKGLYESATPVNKLSEVEELFASFKSGATAPWYQFSWVENNQSLSFDTLRSVNLRPLPVMDGMPVFGVIE